MSYIFLRGKILHPENGVQDVAAADELYYLRGGVSYPLARFDLNFLME
ncbi:MAG: hypothetical protein V1845_02055 [bacterium]